MADEKDKKDLWEALKALLKSLQRLIENKGRIPVLENEIKQLEETVNDMSWVSVSNYDQLEAITAKIDDINKKIAIADKTESDASKIVESAKRDVGQLTNAFTGLQSQVNDFEKLFEECLKNQEKMDYDVSEVNGFVLFYSKKFAFDKELADKQDNMVVYALAPNGSIQHYMSIADMNHDIHFDNPITKEMLEKGQCRLLADMEMNEFTTFQQKGEYVFHGLSDQLLQSQQKELNERNKTIEQGNEQLEKVLKEKSDCIAELKNTPQKILSGQFSEWSVANRKNFKGEKFPQIEGKVCTCALKSGEKLSFTLCENDFTLIDKVTISNKGSQTVLYSLDKDIRENIDNKYLNNNPVVRQILESTPFWAEQVTGDLLNKARLQNKVSSVAMEDKLTRMVIANVNWGISNVCLDLEKEDVNYVRESLDNACCLTDEKGNHLLFTCNETSITLMELDNLENEKQVVTFAYEDLGKALSDSKFRSIDRNFPDIAERMVKEAQYVYEHKDEVKELPVVEKEQAEVERA